jgi:hypothetical protein
MRKAGLMFALVITALAGGVERALAQAFNNVVKPDDAPTADWTLRLQLQFLFPK